MSNSIDIMHQNGTFVRRLQSKTVASVASSLLLHVWISSRCLKNGLIRRRIHDVHSIIKSRIKLNSAQTWRYLPGQIHHHTAALTPWLYTLYAPKWVPKEYRCCQDETKRTLCRTLLRSFIHAAVRRHTAHQILPTDPEQSCHHASLTNVHYLDLASHWLTIKPSSTIHSLKWAALNYTIGSPHLQFKLRFSGDLRHLRSAMSMRYRQPVNLPKS